MKLGVTTSVFAHIAAVALGVVSLSTPRPMNVADVEALPIEIIPIESITKTIKGDKKAKPSKKPAPKATTKPEVMKNAENVGDTKRDTKADAPKVEKKPPVEKTEAPSPEPAPKEPVKPTPKPEPKVEVKPEPKTDIAALVEKSQEPKPEEIVEEAFKEPERVIVPKRRPKPKPKKAESKPSDKKKKADKIAALLNKEAASASGAKRSKDKAALGAKKGNNKIKLSQSEVDALRGQIQSCWNVVGLAGLDGAEKLRAKVEFRLNKDGKIDGRPKVVATGGSKRTNRTFAGSAKRAVVGCAPYELPADKYEDWADVVVNFSLKDML